MGDAYPNWKRFENDFNIIRWTAGRESLNLAKSLEKDTHAYAPRSREPLVS